MLLAFAHIEKTGGTTLIQVLRRNFFLRFVDVRPLHRASVGAFANADLRRYRLINPWVQAISGHAVRPHARFVQSKEHVRFLTILRNPARRYVSQFLYFVRKGYCTPNFESWLDSSEYMNLQTKKIAGSEDVNAAYSLLSGMFAVGMLEEFDAFLLRLTDALKPASFDPCYIVRNVGLGQVCEVNELLQQYQAKIDLRNEKDIELYERVTNELIPNLNARYTGDLSTDLAEFAARNSRFCWGFRDYADFALRKLYYEPISSLIRLKNGLQATGSY